MNKSDFNRRIILAWHEMLRYFMSPHKRERLNFIDFFNSILVLVQSPLLVVLYEKTKEKEVFKRLNIKIIQDPFHVKTLYKKLSKATYKNGDDLFQVFGTDYYLLCFTLTTVDSSKNTNRESFVKERFTKITPLEKTSRYDCKEEYISACLGEMLSLESAGAIVSSYRMRNRLQKEIKESIKTLSEENKTIFFDEDCTLSQSSAGTIKYHEEQEWPVDGTVLDFAYHSLGSQLFEVSELSDANEEKAKNTLEYPNVFFYCKDYCEPRLRRGHYCYNTRIILPEQQKQDFGSIFQVFYDLGKNFSHDIDGFNEYLEVSKNGSKKVYLEKAKTGHEKFLDIMFGGISKKENEFLPELQAVLENRVGVNTRSMSDPIYSSLGAIHFLNPFKRSGQERILLESEKNQELSEEDKEKLLNDRLRVVICHYWFEALAPRTEDVIDDRELAVVMIPVVVNGSIWGVSGHIVRVRANESKPNSDDAWNAIFYYYHSIFLNMQKMIAEKLRTDFIDKFIKGYIYKDKNGDKQRTDFYETMVKISNAKEKFVVSQAKSILKGYCDHMSELCKHYPYDEISFEVISKSTKFLKTENIAPDELLFFNTLRIRLVTKKNKYFPLAEKNDTNSVFFIELRRKLMNVITSVEEGLYRAYV